MIAVDTNILVYAHRTAAPKHEQARQWLKSLAEGDVPWGLPAFVLGEFVRVTTHRSIFSPPSTIEQSVTALENLLVSPSVRLLNPGPDYHRHLLHLIRSAAATGNLAFDAQIAAVCREHGVDRLLTEDRDFTRFPGIRLIDLEQDPEAST